MFDWDPLIVTKKGVKILDRDCKSPRPARVPAIAGSLINHLAGPI